MLQARSRLSTLMPSVAQTSGGTPGGIVRYMGGGIVQESLGANIPLLAASSETAPSYRTSRITAAPPIISTVSPGACVETARASGDA